MRYGPIFGCAFCHIANFRPNVCELKAVVGLAQEQNQRFFNLEFLAAHIPLLRQLGTFCCCDRCKASINAGRLPPLSAVNNLLPTWAHQSASQVLHPLEQEMLANNHVFQHVCIIVLHRFYIELFQPQSKNNSISGGGIGRGGEGGGSSRQDSPTFDSTKGALQC